MPVCLQPDLMAQMQDLHRDLTDADDRATADSLAGGERLDLARQLEDVRQRMLDHTVDFILRALPRRRWTALLAEHPPRGDVERDKLLGVNEETFFESLVRECTVAPKLDDDDWATLADAMSDAQWSQLTNAAWAVNARDVDVPFSRLALRTLANSAPGSSAPNGSASASNGSTGGNPKSKRPTNTRATG